MKKFIVGIDSGSTMCKVALFEGYKFLDTSITKTTWNPKESAKESIKLLLEKNNIKSKENILISATGYGREAITFADFVFTEITCHAKGGLFFMPDIQGIIDIGGQDSKVIEIKNNRVSNFIMNDKCAAGTGQFLNNVCSALDIPIEDLDKNIDFDRATKINSMCAVFAESEIISLLSAGKERSQILAGVINSISEKVSQLVSKFNFEFDKKILMTGGLSKSKSVIDAISKKTNLEIITQEYSVFAGAVGACVNIFDKL